MKLQGLKLNCLGDSITQGAGAYPAENCFVSLLRSRYGIDARNYGIGGARIAPQHKKRAGCLYDYVDYCTRVPDMAGDADLIFVFGGTNDYGHGDAPLGKTDDTDDTTFCGACRVMFDRLSQCYPGVPVMVLLPLQRTRGEGANQKSDGKAYCLEQYVDALRTIAAEKGCAIMDLYTNDPHLPLCDGLHPDNEGHSLLADLIADFVAHLD